MDPEDLLLRLNNGETPPIGDYSEVVELLEYSLADGVGRKPSADEVYTCLLVLTKSKEPRFKPVLERFLNTNDPVTTSLVLHALCLEWGDIEEHIERVLALCFGNTWDADADVRHLAIHIVGEYLAPRIGGRRGLRSLSNRRFKNMIQLLLSLLDDETLEGETRHAAYLALQRAAGTRAAHDLQSVDLDCDFSPDTNDVDRILLAQLREVSSSDRSSS